MDISVVILNHRQYLPTLNCVSSIQGLLREPGCEIILVDNGSGDDSSERVVKQYPRIRLIASPSNIGVAAGRNLGLRHARGRHLMILDNDTKASPEVILQLSQYLDTNPDVGLVAPRLISPEGLTQTSFRPYPGIIAKLKNIFRGKRRSSIATCIPGAPVQPFYVIGAAQMFTREVYDTAGPLDEKIFYGPEDADFCISVRRFAGKKVIYLPHLSIIHLWQRATASRPLSASGRSHIAALLYFYKKHRRFL